MQKPIVYLGKDGLQTVGKEFEKQARKQIARGQDRIIINIAGRIWKCRVIEDEACILCDDETRLENLTEQQNNNDNSDIERWEDWNFKRGKDGKLIWNG